LLELLCHNKNDKEQQQMGNEFTTDLLARYKQQAQQALQTKINNYAMAGISHEVVRDADGTIVEVLTDADKRQMEPSAQVQVQVAETTIATGYECETWHGAFICDEYKYPMPTFCLKDKNYCAKEYAGLMTISNRGSYENHRYLYKNKFNTTELANDLGISRTQLERNIKKLEQLNCNVLSIESTRENGIVYKLDYGVENATTGNTHKFVTIYHPMLKTLACAFNSNAIKLYCLLNYMCKETDFNVMDNKWLAEQIGLSSKSKNNLDSITEIVAQLELCGFIETRKQNIFQWDAKKGREVPQITKSYRLCTLEQWQTVQNKVKNKKINN